jgi:hypothetical protein
MRMRVFVHRADYCSLTLPATRNKSTLSFDRMLSASQTLRPIDPQLTSTRGKGSRLSSKVIGALRQASFVPGRLTQDYGRARRKH